KPWQVSREPAREELQTYLSSFAEWTASLERETRNLRVPLLESPHPHSMTPNWLIATSLVVKSGNERLGMVQHVGGVNANAELLGFGDPERLLSVGVEGPESEPCQGVGRQDPVFS